MKKLLIRGCWECPKREYDDAVGMVTNLCLGTNQPIADKFMDAAEDVFPDFCPLLEYYGNQEIVKKGNIN